MTQGVVMRNFMIMWLVLVAAVAVFAQQPFGYDLARLPAMFSALPSTGQLTSVLIGVLIFCLIGSAIWQADRLDRQGREIKQLRVRLDGVRLTTKIAEEQQRDLEFGVQALVSSDPEEAIISLHKHVADAERQTALQRGRTEAVDLQERVDDIQRRQKALRERIGEELEKRRTSEPVFGQLRERQRQIEGLLAEIETDDGGTSLADRVKKFDDYNLNANSRLNAAQAAFVTLNRLKDAASQCKDGLVPLQDSNNGIRAIAEQAQILQDELNRRLDQLETVGEERLTTRVELLLKSKRETEQRMTGLSECLTKIQTIRQDFITLKEKQVHVEHSLVEAETDDKGRGLAERLSDFNEFMTQAHARLADLENTVLKLNGIKADLAGCQTDLDQLRNPDAGILSIIGTTQSHSDHLLRCLDELELGGEVALAARVEGLLQNKRGSELRIEALKAAFSELEIVRTDIGSLFSGLMTTLSAHADLRTGL
jgi:hypothetical protein